MGVSTSEELQHAISACKDLINTTPKDSEEKKKLVNKLVQLRLKLQEMQVCLSTHDQHLISPLFFSAYYNIINCDWFSMHLHCICYRSAV